MKLAKITWDANKSIEIRRPTCTNLIQPCIWYECEGFRDMHACSWLFGMVHKEWSTQFDLDLRSWIIYHRNLKNEIVHTVRTPYICTSLSNSLQKLGNASEQKFRCFVGIHFDLRGGASEQRHKWAEGACGSRGAPSSGIRKNGERNVCTGQPKLEETQKHIRVRVSRLSRVLFATKMVHLDWERR